MYCHNHAGVEVVGRCSGCAQSFCANCLVPIKGERFCGQCKAIAIPRSAGFLLQKECGEAADALEVAIIGIFCIGILLEPVAIWKAVKAKERMRSEPRLTGQGRATAAMVIAGAVLVLWVIRTLARLG